MMKRNGGTLRPYNGVGEGPLGFLRRPYDQKVVPCNVYYSRATFLVS
jgi:hypothetical protein